MEAKELRIGNYVNYYGGDDQTFCNKDQPRHKTQITGLGKGSISWESSHKYYHSSIEPIPLTEEWLVKFGFEKINQNGYFRINFQNHIYEINVEDGAFGIYQDNTTRYFSWDIKYVHQVQNLYFVLTGSELIENK